MAGRTKSVLPKPDVRGRPRLRAAILRDVGRPGRFTSRWHSDAQEPGCALLAGGELLQLQGSLGAPVVALALDHARRCRAGAGFGPGGDKRAVAGRIRRGENAAALPGEARR